MKKKCTQIFVDIQTYGITNDCVVMKQAVVSGVPYCVLSLPQ